MNKSSLEEAKMELNYFLIFFNDDYSVFYALGYSEYPRIADIHSTIEELRENKELGIGDKIYHQKMDILTAKEYNSLANEDEESK